MGGRTWRETTCDGAIKNIYLGLHYQHTLNDKNPFKEILDLDFYDKKGCLHRTKPKLLPAMRDGQHNSIWKVGQVLGWGWGRRGQNQNRWLFLHTDGTKWVFLDIGSWWFSVMSSFLPRVSFWICFYCNSSVWCFLFKFTHCWWYDLYGFPSLPSFPKFWTHLPFGPLGFFEEDDMGFFRGEGEVPGGDPLFFLWWSVSSTRGNTRGTITVCRMIPAAGATCHYEFWSLWFGGKNLL